MFTPLIIAANVLLVFDYYLRNTTNEDFLFEFFINVIKYLLLIDKKLTERTIIFIFKLSLIIFIYFVILKTIVFAVIHTFCFIF